MEECLPRYLVIRVKGKVKSQNIKKTLIIGLFPLILGLVLIVTGLNTNKQPIATPSPIPQIEGISIATSSAITSPKNEAVLVTKVVDGDTIRIGNQTIRLIGIDTPETVHPTKAVECFGKQASQKTKELLEGQFVTLEKDVSETDKYSRLLRYVYLPLDDERMLFINDFLIREGFAQVLTYPPDVKYDERFRAAEREAKENLRGLWGSC
ncbi:MAG: thermonuclease family protein [Candidatus Daviesbacteria bacterium]|nr:thermonuclease family protein [Candidatus Daviesbacteria bacterium]